MSLNVQSTNRRSQFPENAHPAFARLRSGHFWFETRRRVIQEVLRDLKSSEPGLTLEVGCGDGHLLDILPGRLTVGMDIQLRDLLESRRRGVCRFLIAASGDHLPFSRVFSLVCAFDVIEHLQDDVGFLRECDSVLKRDGRLLLTVPADPALWSHLDVYAGHQRRYTAQSMQAAMESAGLTIECMFPMFRLLWPLSFINARLKRGHNVSDPAAEYSVGPFFNALLRCALRLEWKILGKASFGRGTSWCVVARPSHPNLSGMQE